MGRAVELLAMIGILAIIGILAMIGIGHEWRLGRAAVAVRGAIGHPDRRGIASLIRIGVVWIGLSGSAWYGSGYPDLRGMLVGVALLCALPSADSLHSRV